MISQENKTKTDVFLILSLKLASNIKKHSGSSQNTYFWLRNCLQHTTLFFWFSLSYFSTDKAPKTWFKIQKSPSYLSPVIHPFSHRKSLFLVSFQTRNLNIFIFYFIIISLWYVLAYLLPCFYFLQQFFINNNQGLFYLVGLCPYSLRFSNWLFLLSCHNPPWYSLIDMSH